MGNTRGWWTFRGGIGRYCGHGRARIARGSHCVFRRKRRGIGLSIAALHNAISFGVNAKEFAGARLPNAAARAPPVHSLISTAANGESVRTVVLAWNFCTKSSMFSDTTTVKRAQTARTSCEPSISQQ
jgi:hypothetical protein